MYRCVSSKLIATLILAIIVLSLTIILVYNLSDHVGKMIIDRSAYPKIAPLLRKYNIQVYVSLAAAHYINVTSLREMGDLTSQYSVRHFQE